ncbi:carcinoembryonic antigen-related cell adhesion molecule 20-like [Hippocampus comes]|uniref:Carcinoembryonic antigen-related cell adhesion molecule 20-like n=1 Tax=Hippocampus comes TaxID=109280 RepID=A0A3Q2Y812_HIPCM|nr:PREDICTED: carcinoembryonic antigen-related cell adhesion molecule 20-like [Hippocampus comes]
MDTRAVLCIVSVALTGLTAGFGVLPNGPLTAAVGGSVRFDTEVAPTETPFHTVIWTFVSGGKETPVVTATSQNKTSDGYQGRITLFIQTGSLELRKLALNDSGEYRLAIVTADGNSITGTTTLETLVPVSNVSLTASSTDLVEFNSTVRLSCSSLGSSISFRWMNDSAEILPSDRVQLSDKGATLTVAPVTRYDQRSFRCHVANVVSESSSNSVLLSVSYGPDDAHLDISPQQDYIEEGTNVVLSCSSDSRPAALFTWFVDGKDLSILASNLSLMNIRLHQSGNYSCRSFNAKTLRHKDSRQWPITVIERISSTFVTQSTDHPIEGAALDVTCDGAGSIFFRQWKKGGSTLVPDERVTLRDKNRTLSFRAVVRSDSATYSCQISNPINEEEVAFSVLVNFGPDPVQITGPSQIQVKQTLTLTCSAASVPSATYTWTRLNHTAALHNESTFIKSNVDFADRGSYVCSATNNITGKSTSAVHSLAVTDETVACSAGCIAGIVVACFIICAAAAGGGFAFYQHRNRNKTMNCPDGNASNGTGRKGHDNTKETKTQELTYADLSILRAKNGGEVKLQQRDSETEYAEVRVNNVPPSYDVHMQRMKRRAPQPLEAYGGQVGQQVHSNEWSRRGSGDHPTV